MLLILAFQKFGCSFVWFWLFKLFKISFLFFEALFCYPWCSALAAHISYLEAFSNLRVKETRQLSLFSGSFPQVLRQCGWIMAEAGSQHPSSGLPHEGQRSNGLRHLSCTPGSVAVAGSCRGSWGPSPHSDVGCTCLNNLLTGQTPCTPCNF